MQLTKKTATIASGASLSGAITMHQDQNPQVPVALEMPAAWTAASLTFAVSYDGVTYLPLYDDGGSELTLTVSTSRHVALEPRYFIGVRYLKVRSGPAGTPVNQGGDRDINVLTRPVS